MKLTITEKDQARARHWCSPDKCLVATILKRRGEKDVRALAFNVYTSGKEFAIVNYQDIYEKFYTPTLQKVRKSAIGKKVELIKVLARIILAVLPFSVVPAANATITVLPPGSLIWQQPGYAGPLHLFDSAMAVPWTEGDGTLHTERAWVGRYGDLDGGTFFDTDLFSLAPAATAGLWWNFGTSGYGVKYIVVNEATDGGKIYQVTGRDMFAGNELLDGFNRADIYEIDLYGRVSMPDAGATWPLLSLGLIPLLLRRPPARLTVS